MNAYELSGLLERRERAGERYLEFLRVPTLAAGLYVLPAGDADPQTAHQEDEVYYVVSGHATVRVGTEDRPVTAGSIVYVPARTPHRFHRVTEELRVLVVFTAPEHF